MTEAGENLPADKKMPIDEALTELKAAHASADIAGIDAAMEKVQAASQELYAAAQGGAPQDGAQPGADAGAEDAEVTDVDFEEVK